MGILRYSKHKILPPRSDNNGCAIDDFLQDGVVGSWGRDNECVHNPVTTVTRTLNSNNTHLASRLDRCPDSITSPPRRWPSKHIRR